MQLVQVMPNRTKHCCCTTALVFGVKAYALLCLWIIFLKTPIRDGDKGFYFRPQGQSSEERWDQIEKSFWHRLTPYDGQWYLDISYRGYREFSKRDAPTYRDPPGNLAFFPLLPCILTTTGLVLGEHSILATVALIIIASATGAVVTARLARELGFPSLLTAALLLAFPTAAFQYVLYTEGLFLCLSSLTLFFALKKRPWLAALFGALSGLARPQGILLSLPLLVEFCRPPCSPRAEKRRHCPLSRLGAFAAIASPLSGFVAMSIVSFQATGSAAAFLEIQSHWGRSHEAVGLFDALASAFAYGGPPIDLLGLVFALCLLPFLWIWLPKSLALYGTAMVLMPLATGSLMSLGRFMSVSLPHFLILGKLLHGRVVVSGLVIAAFALIQILLAAGLLAWHFVG